MLYPDCEEIEALAKTYTTIPLCREIYADMATPIQLLQRIAAFSPHHFLLESVEGGEKWARYSFLGFDPVLHVRCKDNTVTVSKGKTVETCTTSAPYQIVRKLLSRYKTAKIKGMPPFTGGFVGYFGYATMNYAEPKLNISSGDFDDFDLMLFDRVIAYDHLKQKICIIVNMETDHIMENYGKAVAEIERIIHILREPAKRSFPPADAAFTCNVSKEDYVGKVEKTKEYIKAGDIFQAVISLRFESPYHGSLFNPYRVLRTTNPSPYMVYMNLGDVEIICSSPETLVRLENRRLCTFPVAGSRPRGTTGAEDKCLERELLADEKELAEHNMLVDLARNDLGKISRLLSVEVVQYMMIHRYSKIMHIASQVESDIAPDRDALDAVEAILPAGTLSGAPKIRACEIIEEIEGTPRGIYGGALGYIDFSGNLDTCIAIRMAVKKDGRVYVQAGGGIVAGSVGEREYDEANNKAKAVIEAILRGREVEAR